MRRPIGTTERMDAIMALAKVIHKAEMDEWPSISADPDGGCLGMDRCAFAAKRVADHIWGVEE